MSTIKSFFQGFKDGFKQFGHNVSDMINFILLGVVYYIGVGIVSIFAKLTGKKFLDLKVEEKESFWVDKNTKTMSKDSYYRMF